MRKDWEPPQNNVSVAVNGALLKLSNDSRNQVSRNPDANLAKCGSMRNDTNDCRSKVQNNFAFSTSLFVSDVSVQNKPTFPKGDDLPYFLQISVAM